jgi:hypothetical protein
MASDVRITNAVRSAMCDALVDLLDAGAGAATIKIYTEGSGRPAGPSTAISDQTLLATLTCSDPAFGAASNGVATASAITSDSSADDTGTATWARIADSNGLAIVDVEVGTAAADLILDDVTITAGQTVACSALTVTVAASN